jgi:peptide/nickel transport system substrate-binding protein
MISKMAAVGALLALALSACTRVGDPGGSTTASKPGAGGNPFTQHGRLVISAAADPKNLDPIIDSSQPTLELSMFLFSYTIRYDEHSQPVPDAVSEIPTLENGDVSRDGRTLKYKLRHDITWHDGEPLTCKDLRFTWQAVMNPHNNAQTTVGYDAIKDVDCSDPYVAVVHMKHVYSPFLQQLWSVNGNAPILPEHLLAKYNDDKGSFNQAPYQSAPVGSGPFKFVSWDRGSQVRLEAYPKYFRGRPGLDEVIYKIIPDGNTLVTQVQTHEVDMGFNMPSGAWDREKAFAGTTAIAPIVYNYVHIDFNLRQPLFSDVRVRRALTYALDRPALLEKVQHGLGDLADTFFDATLSPSYVNRNVMKYPYDPAKARALLDQAGWKVGPGGIRVKNGQRLSFVFSTQTESTTGHALQAQAQSYWRAIGADVTLKNYPTSSFFANDPSGILTSGKYDVATYSWAGAADIDQSAIYSGHYLAPHGQNFFFWNNPVATAKMDDANATVDPKRRIADYMTVQDEFAKDDGSIIMWFRKYPIVYNSDLQGVLATPVISTPFWNTWDYKI